MISLQLSHFIPFLLPGLAGVCFEAAFSTCTESPPPWSEGLQAVVPLPSVDPVGRPMLPRVAKEAELPRENKEVLASEVAMRQSETRQKVEE